MVSPGDELQDLWARARTLAQARQVSLSTFHLLQALAQGRNPAARLLAAHGVDAAWVRLRAALAKPESDQVPRHLEAAAARLARSLRVRRPGPIHLLAALLSLPESSGHLLLREGGVDLAAVTAAVHAYLGGSPRWRALSAGDAESAGDAAPSAPRRLTDRDPLRPTAPRPRARPLLSPARPAVPSEASEAPAEAPAPPSTQPASVPSRLLAPGPLRLSAPKPSKKPAPAELDPKRHPWLAGNARDLRRAAADGSLDPAVARQDVIERLLDVLQKRRGSSPCLMGPAGVGKTAVVHALAHHLAREEHPGIALLELTPAALTAGAAARGSLAERIRKIAAEAGALDGHLVLAVGDVSQFLRAVVEAGDGADQALKEALDSRAFALLGEADPAAWERTLRGSAVLARHLTLVEVPEPAEDAARTMLHAVLPRYAEHHGVEIGDDAVEASVRIARRYLVGRALPDKAVHLLDLAAARAKRAGVRRTGPAEVAAVASEMVDVPAARLLAADGERYLALEEELGRRIVGHRDVLARVSDVLRRNAAGFRGRRPIGSFLFLGPTGVGKTETARAIAEGLFPGKENLVRLDMSEYSEPHSVARLVGAPPGYVGFEAGGMLTELLRRRPYQVVLFDEFEKAHPDVHRLLLQILEDGRLTDGRGQVIDFRNAVVVLTSNLGSELFADRRPVGFGRTGDAPPNSEVLGRARKALPPELWNRIDETMVFLPLGMDEVRRIAELLLAASFAAATAGRELTVTAEPELVDHLLSHGGYEPALGARPMRRAIQRLVEAPLARELLRSDLGRDVRLRVGVRDGTVAVWRLDAADPPGGKDREAACA